MEPTARVELAAFRLRVPPRHSRRDSLSDLSDYSTRRIQPVQQVRVVCPARRSSSVEPPGSFPKNSVQAEDGIRDSPE